MTENLTVLADAAEESSKAWYEGFNNGGEFFSHFVFTLLVSVVISTKWRDYLIDPRKNDAAEFRQKLQGEIDKVELSAFLDPQLKKNLQKEYGDRLEEIKKLEDEAEASTSSLTKGCKIWCIISLFLTIGIIATACDATIGALCLLALWPIPVYRRRIQEKNRENQNKLNQIRETCETVMRTCQNQYDKKLSSEDEKFSKFYEEEAWRHLKL